MHPEVPISFTLLGPDYSIYNVVVGGSPVLRTTSLLPSQLKLVPIYTPGSRGASYSKVPCSRTQHAGAHRVRTHDLEDHDSVALPLSYCASKGPG